MENETITVTRWKHPDCDTALILRGTPEETRRIASLPDYFGECEGGHELMTAQAEQWSEEAFENLGEFDP